MKNKFIIDVKTRPTGDYALLEGPATAMMQKLADELLDRVIGQRGSLDLKKTVDAAARHFAAFY